MDSVEDARQLLFGVTALRLGLIDRAALTRILAARGGNGDRPLGRLLVERGLIRAEKLAAVQAEVDAAVKAQGGDVLRALDVCGPVAAGLRGGQTPGEFDTLGGQETDRAEDGGTTIATLTPAAAPFVTLGSKTESAVDHYATVAELAAGAAPGADAGQSVAYVPRAGDELDRSAQAFKTSGRDAETFSALRYKILRLHATGGLGQVFLARDEELNREVALKEIQSRHADDGESRLRFLIEAEVTGNLEHPGIVPVYGLGRYPDGRPYYAMRFIRGESMKEAVDRFHEADAAPSRDPGERALALRSLLGQLVDVCNAVAYAHSRGVLHRDLKPANVMIGSFGETLVVDWGLAKFKDSPEGLPSSISGLIRPMSAGSGSGSGTLFGSAVGTPQFMSPEQAGGQLDILGPASDVYSLGTILYTILVGKPPFSDRQLSEMLDKVRRGDFRPPREVGRKTPPALNAVCLKAMALKPGDRYESARALADDLEHWMADEPVSVYREPVLARLGRWARRHKTAVASTAALLVTAVVSLGVYSELIRREKARTEHFYLLARRAVDQMLTQLGEEDLADIPQMEPVRAKMLAEAKAFYEQLRKAKAGDPRAARDVAVAGVRLADIGTLIGEEQALLRYDESVGELRRLLARDPDGRRPRDDLARGLHARALLRRKLNRLPEAERDLSEALGLRDNLAREFPADPALPRNRIDTLYHLAALHDRRGRTADASKEYNEAIAAQKALAEGPAGNLDDRRLLGRYTNNLANLVARDRATRGVAKDLYRNALAIQQDVVRRDPVTAFYRYELAKTHGNLRVVLDSDGDLKEAAEHAVADVVLSRRLAGDFRRVPEYRNKLAAAGSNLGDLRKRLKLYDEAGKDLDEAVALSNGLVREHPDHRDYRSINAAALVNRARLRQATKRQGDAEADYLKARDTLRPLTSGAEATPEDLFDLGTVEHNLSVLRGQADRIDEALAHVDQAVKLHERTAALGRTGEGSVPALWTDLMLKFKLLTLKGEFVRCADLSEQIVSLRPDHAPSYLTTARMLGKVCYEAGEGQDPTERAKGYAERALKILREAARRGLLEPDELESTYYTRVRKLLPEGFRELAQAVKKKVRV